MPQRLDAGSVVAAAGAAVLLVSLFLDWYAPSQSAWNSFEAVDLILAALALAALAAAIPLYRMSGEAARLIPERWLPAIGVAALAVVALSLINHPPAAQGADKEVGAWIALAGAIVLALGGVLSRASISLVVTVRPSDTPTTPPPEAAGRATEPLEPPTPPGGTPPQS